jgi:cytidylate kinase
MNASIEALIDRQLTRRQLLERARGPKPVAAGLAPSPLQVITISREAGSGGRPLAERLAARLQFELVDRQILDLLAQNTGARERLIASLDEHARSAIDMWVEGILTGRYIDRREYAHELCRSVTALAEHGHAVIIGRAANVILGPRGGLHVRVTAPREFRVKALMEHLALSAHEADLRIKKLDDERRQFYTEILHADVDNPTDYHLTINTGRVPLDTAEELVLIAWNRYLAV